MSINMKRLLAVLAILPFFSLSGNSRAASNSLTLKGSDTMVILGQRWAEEYMKERPGTVVQVTGGGSGTGIAALINGSTDIAEASRPMKDAEKTQVLQQRGKPVDEIPVALDGISIYVNQGSTLAQVTFEQLKAVYTGAITDWSQLGQPAGPIIAYGRENNSGTYAYFKEHVLGDADFSSSVLSLPGTAAVINAVSRDKKAIGYGGIAYAKGVKVVPVKKDGSHPAVAASMKNVINGTYPISRKLYFYTAGKPEGLEKEFVSWVLSPEGQQICQNVGYYPLPRKKGT